MLYKKGMKNMKNIKTGAYLCNDDTFSFEFGTDLSVAEKASFVNSIVNLVVSDDNYNLIIKNLIFDFYLVDIFTNYNTTELKKSTAFLNDVEQFLEETNIVEIVRKNMVDGLYEELSNAVDKAIEYRTGIHSNPLNEALTSLAKVIEKKINEIDLKEAMPMVQKFAGMTGDFTPESIVSAYMNSDLHKKNVDEVTEAKKKRVKAVKDLDKAVKEVKAESETVENEFKPKTKTRTKKKTEDTEKVVKLEK